MIASLHNLVNSILLPNPYIKNIFMALIVFFIFLLFHRVFSNFVIKRVLLLVDSSDAIFIPKIINIIEKPVRVFILLIGTYLAMDLLAINQVQHLLVLKIFRSLLIILIAWLFYRLADSHTSFSDEISAKLKIDILLITFFSKVIRFAIIALAVVMVAQEWNYDVNGFIAGLGLGGLAFALASKDALANIFGGVVIIMEKPFLIGDSISSGGIEGIVEDISFRSTKIRAANQAVITVPNSKLADQPITNFSRMGKRIIELHLNLPADYETAKLKDIIRNIRDVLDNYSDIDPSSTIVNFEQFSNTSCDIMVHCSTAQVSFSDYLQVKQDINFLIMSVIEEILD